jgi:hypothetical protein
MKTKYKKAQRFWNFPLRFMANERVHKPLVFHHKPVACCFFPFIDYSDNYDIMHSISIASPKFIRQER